MFGLFKKKAKKDKKGAVQAPVSNKSKNTYTPSFGTAKDFLQAHSGDGGSPFGNNMIVINSDQLSVDHQVIVPTVAKGHLSYVVCDPRGTYYNALRDKLLAMDYDVQVVDMEDPLNKTRIDIFEATNVTRNAYWLSMLLSSSVKCDVKEVPTAHNLFMALMQYLLATDGKVTIKTLKALFDKVSDNDAVVLKDMNMCPASKQFIAKAAAADDIIKYNVFNKIDKFFFGTAMAKTNDPNAFAITAAKKKTAFFVKPVSPKHRYLITCLLFNIKALGTLSGDKTLNTMVFDLETENWYNRKLLHKVCSEIGAAMDQCIATLLIAPNIDHMDLANNEMVDEMLIYMSSNSDITKNKVYDMLKIKNTHNEVEQQVISNENFKGKKLPDDVLEKAPISKEEFDVFADCILIDTGKKAKPFTCKRN